ncbi:MAG: amidase [Pseudomonadota bacterium]|nr:amidase [Pseudomonadota bacterium]
MIALHQIGLRAARDDIAAGRLTAAKYLAALLERTARFEPRVQAWQWFDPERAMTLAKQRDHGPPLGGDALLRGIPIAVKDIIDVMQLPTGMGSKLYEGERNVAKCSAKIVECIEGAGAYVLGKTVTAEFAFLAPGKTRNPWHDAHTPGGSSSGSAAAVAAGFVPGAIGTQTNGSVIRPAAFCGVVGFKPSAGTISADGTLSYSPTLDQTGVFTRSVADAAMLSSYVGERPIAVDVRNMERPPTLLAVRSPVWEKATPPQRAMLAANIERLRKDGARVEEIELSRAFDRAHSVLRTIMASEAARYFDLLQSRHRENMSVELNALIDEGRAIADADYRTALSAREDLRRSLAEFLRDADAIITPPAPGEAPATLTHTGDPAFCTIWTLCGVPALSLPVGFGPNRLPLGLQLVGRFNGDDALLAVAQWCEQQLPFKHFPYTPKPANKE